MIHWMFLIIALLFGAVAGWILGRRESVPAGFAAIGSTTGLMLGLSESPVVAASLASIFGVIAILIPFYFQRGASPPLPPPPPPPAVGPASGFPTLGAWLFPFGAGLLAGLLVGVIFRANDALNFASRSLREQYKLQGYSEEQVNAIMEQHAKLISATAPPKPPYSLGVTVLHSLTRPANWDRYWAQNYQDKDTAEENLKRIEDGTTENVRLAIKLLRADGKSAADILTAIKQRFSQ